LGINKKQWKAQILFFPTEAPLLSSKLKKFWSKAGLKTANIYAYENRTVKSENGVCILYINSTTLAEVFYKIYEYCRKLALKNAECAADFFRGVSRGDLGIHGARGRISSITFSTEQREDVQYYGAI